MTSLLALIFVFAQVATPTFTDIQKRCMSKTGIYFAGGVCGEDPRLPEIFDVNPPVRFQSQGDIILSFIPDGKIIVAHPEKQDKTAKEFLEIIKRMWPAVCGCKND